MHTNIHKINRECDTMNSITIEELKKEYPEHLYEVELLITYTDKLRDGCPDKRKDYLEQAQTKLNTLYAVKPAPVLVDVQAVLNEYRNEFDITDPREVVNDEGFVQ